MDRDWPVPLTDEQIRVMLVDLERRIEFRIASGLELSAASLAALKELWHTQHISLEKTVMASQRAQDAQGVRIADDLTRRFESVNEFRSALSDQASKFITRDETFTLVQGVREKMDALGTQVAGISSGAAGKKEGWGLAIGMLSVILTVLTIAGALLFHKS